MFQQGLVAYIAGQSAMTTLLGTPITRPDKMNGIFASLAPPQSTPPFIVYRRLDNSPVYSLAGANKLQKTIFRLSYIGQTYALAARLSEANKVLWGTYSGTWPDGTVVQSVAQLNEQDEAENDATHGTLFTVHIDWEFWFIDDNGA